MKERQMQLKAGGKSRRRGNMPGSFSRSSLML
jgi:hypothetical protein